ncbi:MAG: FHA domain-containing protein [Clostridia bacterium]|nr:FHA domain-containing protein [Clostridia bacterium]
MRTKFYRGIALVLCLICLCSAALAQSAQVAGIKVIGVRSDEQSAVLYVGLKGMGSNGAATKTDVENVAVIGSRDQVPLSVKPLKGSQVGHIIVVDTSRYYYNNEYVTSENLQEIIAAYLDYVPEDEQVMFITAGESEPVLSNYMSREEARAYVTNVQIGKYTSACIYSAICKAFELASEPGNDDPLFNTVMIIADPDLESNNDPAHSLGEASMMYNYSDIKFDVYMTTPRRQRFLEGTGNPQRRQALESSFANFANFAQQVDGKYIEIAQTNDGVTTSPLATAMAAEQGSDLYLQVDYSELRNSIPVDGEKQKVQLSILYNEQREQIVRTVEVEVNTKLMPTPDPTPEPTPEPTATVAPTPTPVVASGQTDIKAMNAVLALYELHYLDRKDYKEFGSECLMAYIEFCRENNIEAGEGIDDEGYALLTSSRAIPKTTPTPQPTATPVPTVPPAGYMINDTDAEPNGFIGQMQTVLKNLNCYGKEEYANYGRLDQATVNAVARYCEHFNWRNDLHPNGVASAVVQDIVTNGEKREPIPDEVPSFREKIIAFLTRDITLGSLSIPTWIPVAVSAVVLFAILILVIVLGGKKKKQNYDEVSPLNQPSASLQPVTPGFGGDPFDQGPMDFEPTTSDDGEETMQPYFSKLVTLTMEFGGRSDTVEAELKEDPPYTIGRKDCQLTLDSMDSSASRRHAELYVKDGQVYVRDKSSHQNTYLNGRKVRSSTDGAIVNNGDRLQLSQHTIIIRW